MQRTTITGSGCNTETGPHVTSPKKKIAGPFRSHALIVRNCLGSLEKDKSPISRILLEHNVLAHDRCIKSVACVHHNSNPGFLISVGPHRALNSHLLLLSASARRRYTFSLEYVINGPHLEFASEVLFHQQRYIDTRFVPPERGPSPHTPWQPQREKRNHGLGVGPKKKKQTSSQRALL